MSLVPFQKTRSSVPAYRGTGFDDFDRVFDNFFRNALTNITVGSPPVSGMNVRIDVSETDKGYLVKADLPGLAEDDIDLSLEDGVLTLSGERLSESEEDGKTVHKIERSYGRFTRVLQLPADADESKIRATMKHGVLSIEIDRLKDAPKKTQRIAIKSA